MRGSGVRLVGAAIGALMWACGGGGSSSGQPGPEAGVEASSPTPEAGTSEGGDDAGPGDHGSPSSTYPAFTPDFAQIADQGGHVMKSPVIVPITWTSDSAVTAFEAFADELGATAYWKATTSEYGIGAATSGTANHVHISTAAPLQMQDSDIQNLVVANAGNAGDGGTGGDAGTTAWPAPTPDTVYAFFLPPGTSLQVSAGLGGGTQDACALGEGGYHSQVNVGSVTTSYAVVPSCTTLGIGAPKESTLAMSHELVEAATDPQPQTPAYYSFDGDHFGFLYFQQFQAETGDACELYRDSFFEDKEPPSPFDAWVQRTWSNAGAKAGHNPCVPAASGSVYFNVTPLALQKVKLTVPALIAQVFPGLPSSTKGAVAGAGASVTFPVGFYSDGPTAGPWSISVAPGNPILGKNSLIDQYNTSSVTASVDKTTGQNGEKAYVTVNVTTPGSLFQGEIVTITSTLGGVSHYMPVWISAQ